MLSITLTAVPGSSGAEMNGDFKATDLGFLLHKNPERLHRIELAFGVAHVVYPEATETRTTASLLLEIDPVALVRSPDSDLGYVNDRPYVASSMLAVAMARSYREAMAGRSRERPDLAAQVLPFEAHLPVVPARGGPNFVRALFEPLGYHVEAEPVQLEDEPSLHSNRYVELKLSHELSLSSLLRHLYVLIPVLDDAKHYLIGEAEVEKLLRAASSWLGMHPLCEEITKRYLRRRHALVRTALERLSLLDDTLLEAESSDDVVSPAGGSTLEEGDTRVGYAVMQDSVVSGDSPGDARVSLHTQRLEAVFGVLLASGARSVLDLGCGEGKLLALLTRERQFERIVGLDVSQHMLEIAARKLRLGGVFAKNSSEGVQPRIALLHGALTYRDRRLEGFDAAALVEVIEHLEEDRLDAFERVVFGYAAPKTVVITTPNAEYNALFANLSGLRHRDHRFEWTRVQFQAWAEGVASRFGYLCRFENLGPVDESLGAPSQMAVFTKSLPAQTAGEGMSQRTKPDTEGFSSVVEEIARED